MGLLILKVIFSLEVTYLDENAKEAVWDLSFGVSYIGSTAFDAL